MIQVNNLSKSYGEQFLLDSVSFNINSRERIGLIGRNGHGKSTLIKILAGLESQDSGTVSIPKNYRVGYLEQTIRFTKDTVIDEACLGLRPEHIHDRWRAEKILSGLGFSADDFSRHPSEFSGGYQLRINLAKVLCGEPNLLLLDEPTNYLDIVAIRWLERFLTDWKNELILITHDRAFMDAVSTHTMIIHRKKMRKIDGGTDKVYEQIALEEEVHEKTRLNDEKKRKEVEVFINRFRAKARLGSMVQSRVKMLEKQTKLSKLETIKNLEFSFRSAPFSGKQAVEISDLAFSYTGEKPYLIENLSMTIRKDDRIGIIGRNGKGKSTLIRLIAGKIDPVKGDVKPHPQITMGYFGQTNIEALNEHLTVEEEILSAHPDKDRQAARDVAGAMLFEGDSALKKIGVLSGGERSRVLLGKLLVSPSHLLLLDEPTNHLDMQSCDSLISAIDSFDGAVVIVTHNEMYLSALVNRLVIFDRGKVSIFEGGYQEFLADIGWSDEDELRAEKNDVSENNKKLQRKARAELIQEKSKILKPIEKEMKSTESEITSRENELHLDTQALMDASVRSDGPEIARLAKKTAETQKLIDKLYDKLAEITDRFETESRKFEEI